MAALDASADGHDADSVASFSDDDAGFGVSAPKAAAAPPRSAVAVSRTMTAAQRGGLNDAVFLALFLAQLVVMVLIAGVVGSDASHSTWLSGSRAVAQTRRVLLVTSVVSAVLGLACYAAAYVTQAHAPVLQYGQRAAAAALGVLALLLLLGGKLLLALLLAVVIAVDFIWFFRSQDQVGFVKVLLGVSAAAFRRHKRVTVLVVAALAVQVMYSLLWANIVVDVLRVGNGRVGDAALLGWLLFCYRWTTTVVKGVIRVSVSGAVSRDLASYSPAQVADDDDVDAGGFGGDSVPLTGGPVSTARVSGGATTSDHSAGLGAAAWRACTHSLGSICAGALVGVATPLLWGVLRALRRIEAKQVCLSCVAPAISVIQGVLVLSHKYAYPDVAMRTLPWFRAARESWQSFNARGLEAVVASDGSDRCLLFLCYIVAAAQSIVAFAVLGSGVRAWTLVLLLTFWFGFAATSLALTCVETIVTALFVSYTSMPGALSQRHPIIYHRLCRITEVRTFQRRSGTGAGPGPSAL